jgi:hypothetical protein
MSVQIKTNNNVCEARNIKILTYRWSCRNTPFTPVGSVMIRYIRIGENIFTITADAWLEFDLDPPH